MLGVGSCIATRRYSAFRRNTRGFMYVVGDCHPGVFGTNVGLNASVTLLFSRL